MSYKLPLATRLYQGSNQTAFFVSHCPRSHWLVLVQNSRRNILQVKCLFWFSFGTIIALALQTKMQSGLLFLNLTSRDSRHASNKREIFRCISTISSSIKTCYIIRRYMYQGASDVLHRRIFSAGGVYWHSY
jgi:hypothetical protein